MGELDPRELYKMLRGLVQLDQGQKELPLEALSLREFAALRFRADIVGVDRDLIGIMGTLWRASRMPKWLDRSFKREWDVFLAPEVRFFFPHRHSQLPPPNLAQTCVLLSDREHLAAVIADGDLETAATYLHPGFDAFWRSIVPHCEALPYSTVWDRMARAMVLLAVLIDHASLLNGKLVALGSPETRLMTPDSLAPSQLRTSKP